MFFLPRPKKHPEKDLYIDSTSEIPPPPPIAPELVAPRPPTRRETPRFSARKAETPLRAGLARPRGGHVALLVREGLFGARQPGAAEAIRQEDGGAALGIPNKATGLGDVTPRGFGGVRRGEVRSDGQQVTN